LTQAVSCGVAVVAGVAFGRGQGVGDQRADPVDGGAVDEAGRVELGYAAGFGDVGGDDAGELEGDVTPAV
jgi:hypothetical protein